MRTGIPYLIFINLCKTLKSIFVQCKIKIQITPPSPLSVCDENLLCKILSVKIFVIKTTVRMLFNPAWKVLSWIMSDKYTVQMADEDVCLMLTSNTQICWLFFKNKKQNKLCFMSWRAPGPCQMRETKETSFLCGSRPIFHWCFNEMFFVEIMFMISQVFVTLHMSQVSWDWKYSGQTPLDVINFNWQILYLRDLLLELITKSRETQGLIASLLKLLNSSNPVRRNLRNKYDRYEYLLFSTNIY